MTAAPVYILDANILIRLSDTTSPQHNIARNAVTLLLGSGALLRVIPQSLFEFWVVATRAQSGNGLGLSPAEADNELFALIRAFPIVPDDPTYVTYWRGLVVKYAVGGKQAHDARYIASMQAHGLTHFLSFDSDFNRYIAEGITVLNPVNVPFPTIDEAL